LPKYFGSSRHLVENVQLGFELWDLSQELSEAGFALPSLE
jgi:hypothetical protein